MWRFFSSKPSGNPDPDRVELSAPEPPAVPMEMRFCSMGRTMLRSESPLEQLHQVLNWLVEERHDLTAVSLILGADSPVGAVYHCGSRLEVRPWNPDGTASGLSPSLLASLARGEVLNLPREDLETWPGDAPYYPVLVAPVLVAGGLGGLVGISGTLTEVADPSLAAALAEFAGDVGLALGRVQRSGELHEQQTGLETALDSLDCILRLQDPETGAGSLLGDQALARILGRDILTAPDRVMWLLDRIHPADRTRVERAWRGPYLGEPGEETTLNYRVQTLDGVARSIEEVIRVRHDEMGRPTTVVAELTDISSRRRAEQESLQFQEVVDRDSRVIFVLRSDGLILYANQSAQANLGAEPGRETQSFRLADFLDKSSQHALLNTVLPEVASRGTWMGDLTLYHWESREPYQCSGVFRELSNDGSDGLRGLPEILVLVATERSQMQRDQQRWVQRLETLRLVSEASTAPAGSHFQRTVDDLLRIIARHNGVPLTIYAEAAGSSLVAAHIYCEDPTFRAGSLDEWNLLEIPAFQTLWRAGDLLEILQPNTGNPGGPLDGRLEWIAGLPVSLGPRRHGLLVVLDSAPHNQPLDPSDVVVLKVMARSLSSALERQKYRADMFQALDQAEAANQAKSHFLAMMSHEVRTPLNGVLGFVELLRATGLSSHQVEAVNTIESSSRGLVRLLGDILDYTKIEAGDLELDLTAVEIRRVLEEISEQHVALTTERGVELIWSVDSSVPVFMDLDEGRFRQILDQLLGHAVRHTFEGLVHVSLGIVPAEPGEGRVGKGKDLVLLGAIRDTGLGYTPEEATRLFRPFSMAGDIGSGTDLGMGLGLAITKRLCNRMGGDVEVRSEKDVGTTLSFHLRARQSVHTPTSWLTTPSPDIREPLAGRSAVLVSDLRELRHAVTALLLHWRMKVTSLGHLRDLPENALVPDLVIACEEDILEQGGVGIVRERLGSIPLVLMQKARRDHATPVPSDDTPAPGSLSTIRVIRINRPARASVLHSAIMGAIEPGMMDSTQPRVTGTGVAPLASRHPLRILVVEDNPTNLRVALLLLSNLGYEAHHVVNGMEAVDSVRSRAFDPKSAYDLVLMDVHMPIMDGLEATREIRRLTPAGLDEDHQLSWISQPYICAVTADALTGDRDKCLASGMDDYLSKPISLDELRRMVKRASRARQQMAVRESG